MFKNLITTTIAAVGLVLALACGGTSDPAPSTDSSAPAAEAEAPEAAAAPDAARAANTGEAAGELANRIAANPDQADAILQEAGYTRESFQALLLEIAGDATLSANYTAARN